MISIIKFTKKEFDFTQFMAIFRSHDSIVGITTGYGLGNRRVRV